MQKHKVYNVTTQLSIASILNSVTDDMYHYEEDYCLLTFLFNIQGGPKNRTVL